MKFVYPEFLFALALIAIPIIIHLFNFRRFKKVLFTNVRFLKELKEETNSRSRLKHLLVLASRILAVSFLVLAFAQPFIPQTKGSAVGGEKAISIFVDNSFSMDAVGKEGTLLQQAIDKAKEIALAFKPSDKFQLLTNDLTGSQQRLMSREEFLEQLQQIKPSTSSHTLNDIVLRQSDALKYSGAKENSSYIISDFQKSVYDFSPLKPDSTIKFNLMGLESQQKNNVYVDSVWLSSPIIIPGQPCEITVRLHNSGEKDVENIPLKVLINNVQKAVATLSLAASSSAETKVNVTFNEAGWQRGEIDITDYPITFDDKYYFSLLTEQHANVLAINQNSVSEYLQRVFIKEGFFTLNNASINQVDYNVMQQSRAVVLNDLKSISSGMIAELNKYVVNGGTLIVFPDSLADRTSYDAFSNSFGIDKYSEVVSSQDKIDKIDLKSDIYNGVFEKVPDNLDVPLASKHFDQTIGSRTGREVLLKLQGGGAILSRYLIGKGKVYLFTIPLNDGFSNLVNHWLFAPTLYRIGLLAKPIGNISYTIGADQSFNIDAGNIVGEEVFHITSKPLNFDVVAKHVSNNGSLSIYFGDQIKQAGNYDLMLSNNIVAVAALNYNRNESDMSTYTRNNLEDQIEKYSLHNFKSIQAIEGNFTKQLSELNEGISLWKYCIFAGLIFLLLEILLLKFWK